MSVSPHYDEEALIALLDRPRSISNDEHVSSCETCSSALDSYRSIIETLGEKPVWNFGRTLDEPVKKTITALRAAAASMRSEDEIAEGLFAELTAGPREQWMPRLLADAKYRTAAMVRRLSVASDAKALKSPGDDLELTKISTEIADHLDHMIDPQSIARLRGCAWRDRAYALNAAGDAVGALEAIKKAEHDYAEVPIADYDVGRLQLTRALVLHSLDRFEEGLLAVRAGSRALAAASDVYRLRIARSLEGYLLYRAGDSRKALQVWRELDDELAHTNDPTRGSILHNISVAYRDLGDLESALVYLKKAAEAHAEAGEEVNIAKTRWIIASILVRQGRYQEADLAFASVIAAFENLAMREDIVLAQLDRAELLILQHRFDEAATVCGRVIEDLRQAGLEHTMRALTAVSYLAEATAARRATSALAHHVREFVNDVRTQPTLVFAPPPL